MDEPRAALPGSERQLTSGVRTLGPVDPAEPVEVSVLVRSRGSLDELEASINRGDPPLGRDEFAARYGADPADMERVEAFARDHRLEVVQSDATRRTVVLRGPAAAMNAAFGVDLHHAQAEDGTTYRTHVGPVYVPTELSDIVQAVVGLDTHPVARRR